MKVGYKAIRELFTSRVTLDRANMKILVEYVDGPFSHLENIWTFKDEDEARRLARRILHRLRIPNRMLGALMGSMFDIAFHNSPTPSRSGRTRFTGRGPFRLQLAMALMAFGSRPAPLDFD